MDCDDPASGDGDGEGGTSGTGVICCSAEWQGVRGDSNRRRAGTGYGMAGASTLDFVGFSVKGGERVAI